MTNSRQRQGFCINNLIKSFKSPQQKAASDHP